MKRSRFWPGAIFALLAVNVVIVGTTIYFAASDPSAAVEPQYYQKALAWDDAARAREASDRLGWLAMAAVEDGRLTVTLHDAAGAPVQGAEVRVTAFAVARAADRQDLDLASAGPGRYDAPIRLHRAGLWELRIQARRGQDEFLRTLELDVGGAPPVAAANPGEGRDR